MPIKIKFKIPFFRRHKEEEDTISIKFDEIDKFVEEMRKSGIIKKYMEMLEEKYENFLEELNTSKEMLKKLEEEGEKSFSKLALERLEKVEKVEKTTIKELNDFYTKTFSIIQSIINIPGELQYKVLEFEGGKETLNTLNKLIKRFEELRKVLLKRFEEYSIVNQFEVSVKLIDEVKSQLGKIKEMKKNMVETSKELEALEKEIEKLLNEKEGIEENKEKEGIKELEIRIKKLEEEKDKILSEITRNIFSVRREIEKILHEKDIKLYEFFKKVGIEDLEREECKKILEIVKKNKEKMGEKERLKIERFLEFCERRMKDDRKKLSIIEKEMSELKKEVKELIQKTKDKEWEIEKLIKEKRYKLKNLENRKERIKKEIYETKKNIKKKIRKIEIVFSRITKPKKVRIILED